jgi:hypothetical protein
LVASEVKVVIVKLFYSHKYILFLTCGKCIVLDCAMIFRYLATNAVVIVSITVAVIVIIIIIILKYEDLNRNSGHLECESKNDTDYNRGDWNCVKITDIHEQHTRKARNKELQKNSHIGHCTHTTESATVKVRNIFHG